MRQSYTDAYSGRAMKAGDFQADPEQGPSRATLALIRATRPVAPRGLTVGIVVALLFEVVAGAVFTGLILLFLTIWGVRK